ncbi:MAG: response regulator [Candidatus Altiarchaeota archaeon]
MNVKPKILVVEDNLDIQSIYSQILPGKYDITQVTNTKDAWKAISETEYDLMILDIILPKGAQGDRFYIQLSQNPEFSQIPVLFVTVIDDHMEAKTLGNINRAEWLTKPFTEEALLAKIKTVLSKK